jgi:hypothetical protein
VTASACDTSSDGFPTPEYRQFITDGVTLGKRDDLTNSGRRKASAPGEPYDDRILGGGNFIDALRTQRELAPEISTNIGINGVVVGQHLGLGRSGVSVAAGRGEQLLKNALSLLTLIDK